MLTDKQCKKASCPEGKARVRMTDSGGLYLEVAGAGSKRWFWKYYFDSKEKRLSLGSYPEVSLKDARASRDEARKQHQSGADPVLARQVDRLSSRFDANASFEVTAREFHATKKVGWSEHYAKRWLERLGKDIFPWLGKLPLSQIGAPMLLQTLRRVEARGVRELPHSLLEACSQVFRYGVSTGRCERNPAADLRGALTPVLTRHVWERTERVFGPLFEARDADMGVGVHLMMAALIRARREQTYEVESLSLMLTSEHWIPVEGVYELPLIQALVAQQRRFVKPLRYDARSVSEFANALLLDADPVAVPLHLLSPFMNPAERAAKERAIAARGAVGWVWRTEDAMPSLPALHTPIPG
jgi:hypothetical protein